MGGRARGRGHSASKEAKAEVSRVGGAVGREEPEGQELRHPLQERCQKTLPHVPQTTPHTSHGLTLTTPTLGTRTKMG